MHLFNTEYKFLSNKQVLHLDDPEYTESELNNLLRWENFCTTKGKIPILICTNSFTYTWLTAKLVNTQVFIVEQGFHSLERYDSNTNAKFSCVYTSPYIHYGNDKHAKHSTWGAELLIDQLIPRLNFLDPGVEIHLVGEIGKHARKELAKLKNIHVYGRVNFKKNITILSSCHIGIYPRTFDHRRSILKIFSYIGAGLPIVTFDLIDTEVVKLNSLGFAVGTVDEFITRILELKNSSDLMQKYKENISVFRINFTWSILAAKMENILAKV